ncbi:MAG: relaxase domain-containing protein [Defluviicoccus sp.]|nr:relaxase domain-containing protein [Defluviicoccus sp.]
MVATVRNLTSSSSVSDYFRRDGGYYAGPGEDAAAARAKEAEHRRASGWFGEGAEALGLEEGREVAAGTFEKVLQGRVPGTDVRLGRLRDGQHEHRPGFDITFSAPKSVSLAAALPTEKRPRGDRAVIRAHDEAVRATLEWIEGTLLETRGWDPATGQRPRVKSPSMVAALFRHVASRNRDPQLHTHAVVANMTRGADGRWKSVEPTLLHRNARLIGAYYRNELARRLTAKGYSLVPGMAGRVPSFEIAGYGRALRDAFSTRRREIVAWVEEKGLDRTVSSMQKAAFSTRRRKSEPVQAKLREEWLARLEAEGLGAAPAVRSREPAEIAAAPTAIEIVGRAMEQLEERQPVFAAHDLEAVALAHSPGAYSIGAVREAVAWMVRDGHLVEAALRGSDRAFVTDRTLKAERKVIAAMKAGIGKADRLAGRRRVEAHLDGSGLTPGQQEAVRTILLARDRIVGVQGRAGTGKTTMLRHVRELAEGRAVIGLAPSAAAARVLERETDIHARTLQWFLTRCQGAAASGRADGKLKEMFGGSVLVLDEASMVSTDQMRQLMRIADGLGVARLVLAGDRSQLRAVEAGQPFRQMQDAGMTTARMDDILRQKNPELKAAVLSVLEGDPGGAMEMLGAGVHEVDHDDLGTKAAEAWLALDRETRDGTLLLAPTHALREEINATVRDALAAEGVLRGRALRIERLVNLGMTRAEKGDVRNYRDGDLVLFHQDLVNYRVRKDDVLTVSGIEHDSVVLAHPDGKPRRIRPAGSVRYRLEVYETREIELRAGDRIRWTRNDKERSLINGEKAEITEIARGRVRLALADGRTISLGADDPQLRHVDHAWSSTVHGAQGSTADRVIAVLDSSHRALTDQSTFYVEISRARHGAEILTDNREQLIEVLMADTGERPTGEEAIEEGIAPTDAELAALISEKEAVWTPLEEWRALEEAARREGTVLFLMEDYGALVESARGLVGTPDLAADAREFADGLIAYDRACREDGKAAEEYLGLIGLQVERRRPLDAESETAGRAVARCAEYKAWRDMADRLVANGPAVLAHPAIRTAEAADAIARRLELLSSLLDLDDKVIDFETLHAEFAERAEVEGTVPFHVEGHGEFVGQARALAELPRLPAWLRPVVEETIAEAAACKDRCAEIQTLNRDTDRLLEERLEQEAKSGLVPPSIHDAHSGWQEGCEEAERRWQAMQADPGTWKPHLDALKDEAAAIGEAIERFDALRGHDAAWAELSEMREAARQEADSRDCLPFYLETWDALVDKARALDETPRVPDGAALVAKRVLDDDRNCRDARAGIDRVLDGEKPHGEYWETLREEKRRRDAAGEAIPTIDLSAYRPLDAPERELRKTGRTIMDDEERHEPHLARIPDGRETVARALARLDAHALLDRCAEVSETLGQAERDAVDRGIALSSDAACRNARREARGLAGRDDVEEETRDRLEAELAAQADRAAVWLELLLLAREMEALAREYEDACEEAARQDVPRPLLPEWVDWVERAGRFVDDAAWALHDADLVDGWRELTDLPARIGEELERMEERVRLPAHEEARIDRMLEAETARLRDPEAGHEYGHGWWGQEPLAAGDRLELAAWRDGPGRQAVVIWPGADGGCASGAMVALEWAGAEGSAEWVSARDLAGSRSAVRRASWSDERLREAALARADTAASADLPLYCRNDLAVGDRVRWVEIVEARGAAREGAPADRGRPAAVTVEAELIERSTARREEEDRCTLQECWRSDGTALAPVDVSFGLLVAGGAMRAFQDDEEKREREKREREKREQEERRRIEREQAEREQAERQRFIALSMSRGMR